MFTQHGGLSPAERRYAKTRRQILAAAHKLIKKKGIEGLTVRALAEAMDYTPAALYRYFQNKEEILEGLRQEGWALFRAMNAQAARATLGVPELLKSQGRAYQEFAVRYPEYYLLMFASTEAAPHSLKELEANPDFKRGTDLIQASVDAGGVRLPPGITPLQIRFLIWFASHGMAMLKLTLLRECGPELEATGQEAIDALVALISKRSE